jgi:NAD(P)-dependent dehydrogenase (short-subunit alcohol dehydrogenase family)
MNNKSLKNNKNKNNTINKNNNSNKKYTIIITGANRGLGEVTINQIAEKYRETSDIRLHLIAVCRNAESCAQKMVAVAAKLKVGDKVECMELDLASAQSIRDFACEINRRRIRADILINNAGIYNNERTRVMNYEILREIMITNFFGTYYLIRSLFPLRNIAMSANANKNKNNKNNTTRTRYIINISSSKGALGLLRDPLLKENLIREDITPDMIEILAYDMMYRIKSSNKNIASNTFVNKDPQYGHFAHSNKLSKIFLNAFSRSLDYLFKKYKYNANINCVDPGWIATNMGGEKALRTVEQGADTVMWLVDQSIRNPGEMPSGKFWRDRRELDWNTAEFL